MREEYSRDLTNLNSTGRGWEEIRKDGECLQFVQQFWEAVWYN